MGRSPTRTASRGAAMLPLDEHADVAALVAFAAVRCAYVAAPCSQEREAHLRSVWALYGTARAIRSALDAAGALREAASGLRARGLALRQLDTATTWALPHPPRVFRDADACGAATQSTNDTVSVLARHPNTCVCTRGRCVRLRRRLGLVGGADVNVFHPAAERVAVVPERSAFFAEVGDDGGQVIELCEGGRAVAWTRLDIGPRPTGEEQSRWTLHAASPLVCLLTREVEGRVVQLACVVRGTGAERDVLRYAAVHRPDAPLGFTLHGVAAIGDCSVFVRWVRTPLQVGAQTDMVCRVCRVRTAATGGGVSLEPDADALRIELRGSFESSGLAAKLLCAEATRNALRPTALATIHGAVERLRAWLHTADSLLQARGMHGVGYWEVVSPDEDTHVATAFALAGWSRSVSISIVLHRDGGGHALDPGHTRPFAIDHGGKYGGEQEVHRGGGVRLAARTPRGGQLLLSSRTVCGSEEEKRASQLRVLCCTHTAIARGRCVVTGELWHAT